MTTTDDERREVAGRLRELSGYAGPETGVDAFDLAMALGLEAVSRTGYDAGDVRRLADLVDPTCEMEVKDGHACCGRFAMATSDERHEAAARLRRMPVGDDLSVHEIARAIGARYDEDRDTSVGVLERLAELIEPGTRAAGTRQGRDGRRGARAQAGRAIAPVPGNNI